MMTKYCLIDIGSNNVLFLLAEVDNTKFRILNRLNRVSALGQDMKNSNLHSDALNRLKVILAEYIELARENNALIYLIGTSALREAKNGNLLGIWLKNVYNLDFITISGENEARLNGIANLNEFPDTDLLLFDIGGGSTEFTLIQDNSITICQSIPLGIRRLFSEFGSSASQQIEKVRNLLAGLSINIPDSASLTGIGGTVTSLAAIQQNLIIYDEQKVHKTFITLQQLDLLIDQIISSSPHQVQKLIPFNPISKDLLLTGAMIVREIIAHFDVSDFFVSDRNWQFGLLQEIINGSWKL